MNKIFKTNLKLLKTRLDDLVKSIYLFGYYNNSMLDIKINEQPSYFDVNDLMYYVIINISLMKDNKKCYFIHYRFLNGSLFEYQQYNLNDDGSQNIKELDYNDLKQVNKLVNFIDTTFNLFKTNV